MAGAESIRQVARARAPFSAWLGIVLLFVLFGVIVLAVIGPTPRAGTYEQKRAKAREEKLKMAREEDAKALGSYAWIDKNKGVARIPIARAMELTVADLTKKEPEPAGPIAAPAAPASAAPTGAPAPSASPTPTGTPKPTSVAGPNSESRGQPAAAVNPPPAPPGTQPGGAKPPAASPAPPAAKPNPAGSPSATPAQPTPGTPTPAPIKTP
ncbi:MAG: hypothetical protein DMF34_04900 [Verrucomicrobia bacterium]|nr:MAG: hypothetical protein DMF34_04900 [Verrucomicrobiota bacterium]